MSNSTNRDDELDIESDTGTFQRAKPQTFGQRHAISILTAALFGALGLVMLIQVGC